LRLGVRQGLDCRPQLIDQRVAVANLLSLFDAGQSIPQCQQALGAERGASFGSTATRRFLGLSRRSSPAFWIGTGKRPSICAPVT